MLTLVMPASGQPTAGYILGPEDVLEVTVWGYPDLTRIVTVRPDGKISLPIVGSITAAGLSVERLTPTPPRAYAAYINTPQVPDFSGGYSRRRQLQRESADTAFGEQM